MAALEHDELSQKRGAVLIWYCITKERLNYSQADTGKSISLVRSLPIRLAGIHLLSNDVGIKPILNFAAYLLENKIRVRVKFHFGSAQEGIYALMTYGIPRAILPVDDDGNISNTLFHSWIAIQEQKAKSARVGAISGVTRNDGALIDDCGVPGEFDVLMGRGKIVEASHGNHHLRCLVAAHYSKYDEAPRCEKNVVCQWVYNLIHQQGGRFLKKDGRGGWETISEAKAIEKISHDFRNYRTRGPSSAVLKQEQVIRYQPVNWI